MKKLLSFGLTAISLFTFCSCESPASDSSTDDQVKVEASLIETLQSNIWMFNSVDYGEGSIRIYDAEYDHYHNANLYQFKEDGILSQIWHNKSEVNGYIEYQEPYTLEDSLLIGCGRLLDPDSGFIRIENDTLHMRVEENGSPYSITFVPYSGLIPLESWKDGPVKDSFEDNNEVTNAKAVELNKNYDVTLSRLDYDWYAFDVEAGKKYMISLHWPLNMDIPSYHIYDAIPDDPTSWGIELESVFSDTTANVMPRPRGTFTAEKSETYYLSIDAYEWSEGSYMFKISDTE